MHKKWFTLLLWSVQKVKVDPLRFAFPPDYDKWQKVESQFSPGVSEGLALSLTGLSFTAVVCDSLFTWGNALFYRYSVILLLNITKTESAFNYIFILSLVSLSLFFLFNPLISPDGGISIHWLTDFPGNSTIAVFTSSPFDGTFAFLTDSQEVR